MHASSLKIIAALALSSVALGAFASTYDGDCTTQPKAKWMSSADVKAKFEAQGYSVGRVKTGGSCYEVYSKDKDGRKVELFVNPVDASVVGQAGKK
ncbi:MAG: PepSY domain-containing protein [Burkholderiaceae bacterium]